MCLECLRDPESLEGHIVLVDSVDLKPYSAPQRLNSDQVAVVPIFVEILRDRRKKLSEAQRKRWNTISTNSMQWLYPFSVEKQYQKWITDKMVEYSDIALPVVTSNIDRWAKEYNNANTIATDAYDAEVDFLINRLHQKQQEMFVYGKEALDNQIRSFAESTSVQNQGQFEKFQRVAIGTTFQPQEDWIRGTIKTWVTNNHNLLRGMTDEYIKKLELEVVSGFQDGLASSSIIANIKKMDKTMTTTRAKLLGRDQIGKLNGIYSKNRMQQAGLSMYIWMTALDERVRDTHRAMEGSVNKWNDASVYSKDNGVTFINRPSVMQGAIPGSQIQCRCTSKPHFDELIGNIDTEIQENTNG